MRLRSFALLSVIAGCGNLQSYPGSDFGVDVAETKVSFLQRLAPYDLEFSVHGCDDFDATVSVQGREPLKLDAKPVGRGRFTASVPIEALHVPGICQDAEHPSGASATLDVTCNIDGRMDRHYISVDYAPAWRESWRGRGPVDAVFASSSPDRFYEMGSGWLNGVVGKESEDDTEAATGSFLVEAPEGTVYVWSRCPVNDCGLFWFAPTPAGKPGNPAGLVQVFERQLDARGTNRLWFRKNITAPGDAFDFVYEPAGGVIVSRLISDTGLTRVTMAGTSAIGTLYDEHAVTKFARLGNDNVFVTETASGAGRLRRSDGSLVSEFALPGSGEIDYASLSPNADALIVIRNSQVWITRFDGGAAVSAPLATELETLTHQAAEYAAFGAAWTTSGIVLRDENGIEMFSLVSPFERKWKMSVDAWTRVRSALGVGESVVVLTTSGVRIFDANGGIVGGADPMDPSCVIGDFYARHLAVVAPNVVALAGKNGSYQFRVDGIPAAGSP